MNFGGLALKMNNFLVSARALVCHTNSRIDEWAGAEKNIYLSLIKLLNLLTKNKTKQKKKVKKKKKRLAVNEA